MESALSVTTTRRVALFTVSKAQSRRRLCGAPLSQCLPSQDLTRQLRCSRGFLSSSLWASVAVPLVRSRPECVSSSASSFASGGGNGGTFGGENGGGGGGENGSDGGDAKSNLVSGGSEEVLALSTDVIILDVGPQVSSASVNLVTETAIVWPVSEAKVTQNWQQQLGEALANHLTSCGFKSNLRVAGQGAIEGEISA
ncbi:copper-transporting ATPase PAA1, chloroplastic-like isoform X3 [Carya illinoinensis]|uniref:copper-transporting ATPase PAA1, chloroplastic-like isoform X3 n=1 Tax=Carya illinoinensis TaxID=32201 RepID=UPI001C71B8E5|nr:copper-transporting ATPase PAA1, chloroplastic-like isoform X3 [Carya illinoinensis]